MQFLKIAGIHSSKCDYLVFFIHPELRLICLPKAINFMRKIFTIKKQIIPNFICMLYTNIDIRI